MFPFWFKYMSRSQPRSTPANNPRHTAPGDGWFLPGANGRRSARAATWLAGIALTLLLAGCSFKEPQSTLDPRGLVAREQINLFYVTVWVSLFIFVILGTGMAIIVWKYRERPGDENKPMPSQGHGNPLIEIGLITASIALLVIIAIPTLKAIWLTDAMPTDQPYWKGSLLGTGNRTGGWYPGDVPELSSTEPLEITVQGKQWWWGFEYRQFGVTTANEMVIPAGKVIKFNLRSDNVIHSFWLPKIAGKVDLIPGRANWMWMMADDDDVTYENGLFYGQCAQYCGEAHAYMLFRARVVSDEDFAKWIADSQRPILPPGFQAPARAPGEVVDATKEATQAWLDFQTKAKDPKNLTTPEERGAAMFIGRATCILCHTLTGTPAAGTQGPNLSRVATRTALAAGFLDNLKGDITDQDRKLEIDPEKQRDNFKKWVTHSNMYKPGSLMWWNPMTQAGLEGLRYQGITVSRLPNAHLSMAQVEALDLSDDQRAKLKPTDAIPDPNLSLILTRGQLEKLTAGLSDDDFSKISNWPSDSDFNDIVAFLMTLK
jgi:cytochrome c oxidase subunit 2